MCSRTDMTATPSYLSGPRIKRSISRREHSAFPCRAEQRAIAGVLGALDDKIEQNRRTAQALERLARAIFRAWFVDFEPVKAKAAGATAFPSMPQPVFDALPNRFVDSDNRPRAGGVEGEGARRSRGVPQWAWHSRSIRREKTAPTSGHQDRPASQRVNRGRRCREWLDRLRVQDSGRRPVVLMVRDTGSGSGSAGQAH